MNIRQLQRGLTYRGRVAAVRQTYHVFEAPEYYFVLSFALARARRASGYFNAVNKAAVAYVQGHLGGRSSVTAKDALAIARRTKHVPTSLMALCILYVLVALGQARIVRSGEHRQLFFAVRKPARPGRPGSRRSR
jgi:hypothetical protein